MKPVSDRGECVCLSVRLCDCTCICLCVLGGLILCLSVSVGVCLRLWVFVCVCGCLFMCLYPRVRVCVFVCVFGNKLNVCLRSREFLSMFMYLCISLFVFTRACILLRVLLCVYVSLHSFVYVCDFTGKNFGVNRPTRP